MTSLCIHIYQKKKYSLQEAIYHIMPEFWLKKVFAAVMTVNWNLPKENWLFFISNEPFKVPTLNKVVNK